MSTYCAVPEVFVNHLKQNIQPNSKVIVVTTTKGATVREGTYLGMTRDGPLVSVSFAQGGYGWVKVFVSRAGRVYAA